MEKTIISYVEVTEYYWVVSTPENIEIEYTITEKK